MSFDRYFSEWGAWALIAVMAKDESLKSSLGISINGTHVSASDIESIAVLHRSELTPN